MTRVLKVPTLTFTYVQPRLGLQPSAGRLRNKRKSPSSLMRRNYAVESALLPSPYVTYLQITPPWEHCVLRCSEITPNPMFSVSPACPLTMHMEPSNPCLPAEARSDLSVVTFNGDPEPLAFRCRFDGPPTSGLLPSAYPPAASSGVVGRACTLTTSKKSRVNQAVGKARFRARKDGYENENGRTIAVLLLRASLNSRLLSQRALSYLNYSGSRYTCRRHLSSTSSRFLSQAQRVCQSFDKHTTNKRPQTATGMSLVGSSP